MNIYEHDKNKLTKEEYDFFSENGYLIIKEALNTDLVDILSNECDQIISKKTRKHINEGNLFTLSSKFLELATLPTILPKVAGLLGYNIWITSNHVAFHPPHNHSELKDYQYFWHRDGGTIETDLIHETVPMWGVKVAFYLTNTENENSGTTYYMPGTHLTKEQVPDHSIIPKNAIPMNLPAGSAIIVAPRIIHSLRSPNLNSDYRKAVFLQWSYRWIKTFDCDGFKDREKIKEPILRQFLGFSDNISALQANYVYDRTGYYYPTDNEIPLKEYVRKLYGSDLKKDFKFR